MHVDSASLGLSGYIVHRQDRAGGHDPHGGVLLCVKHFLNPLRLHHSTNHEIVFVEITNYSFKLTIAGIYRTPTMSVESNYDFVHFIRQKLNNTRDYLLLGDLNYPGINWHGHTLTYRLQSPQPWIKLYVIPHFTSLVRPCARAYFQLSFIIINAYPSR